MRQGLHSNTSLYTFVPDAPAAIHDQQSLHIWRDGAPKGKAHLALQLEGEGKTTKIPGTVEVPTEKIAVALSLMSTFALSAAFIASFASSCTGLSLPHLNPHQIQTLPLPSILSIPSMQMLNFSALFSNFSNATGSPLSPLLSTIPQRSRAASSASTTKLLLPRFP